MSAPHIRSIAVGREAMPAIMGQMRQPRQRAVRRPGNDSAGFELAMLIAVQHNECAIGEHLSKLDALAARADNFESLPIREVRALSAAGVRPLIASRPRRVSVVRQTGGRTHG